MRRFALFILILAFSFPAYAASKRVVALGDSLTAGYGLNSGEDFVTKLQEKLVADGLDVKIENAGVSGDTMAAGKARLEWAIGGEPKPDLVIVALGANDMLRGLDIANTKENLTAILKTLKDKDIKVLLAGMKASKNMGQAYGTAYDAMYADLAEEYGVVFYPFFLEGVALNPELNQTDGIHPNQKGVAVMVEKLAPVVKQALQ
jgi:acyl-CoA thioesterase-1